MKLIAAIITVTILHLYPDESRAWFFQQRPGYYFPINLYYPTTTTTTTTAAPATTTTAAATTTTAAAATTTAAAATVTSSPNPLLVSSGFINGNLPQFNALQNGQYPYPYYQNLLAANGAQSSGAVIGGLARPSGYPFGFGVGGLAGAGIVGGTLGLGLGGNNYPLIGGLASPVGRK